LRRNGDSRWGPYIKSIRTSAKLTQEQLAYRLEVTFSSVNRWENGLCTPNRRSQKDIRALGKEFSVEEAER